MGPCRKSIVMQCISGCVSVGSMGSVEPMEFPRRFREPMDFEQILKQMQENMMFEV